MSISLGQILSHLETLLDKYIEENYPSGGEAAIRSAKLRIHQESSKTTMIDLEISITLYEAEAGE